MSDHCGSTGGDSDGSASGSKLCRDYLRNVCKRGSQCRFVHPENMKVRTDPIFCHDFQQGRCFRSNCKFIHCSREEEEAYLETGILPEETDQPARRPYTNGGSDELIPLCKDFLKGLCDRPSGGCKFRHAGPSPRLAGGYCRRVSPGWRYEETAPRPKRYRPETEETAPPDYYPVDAMKALEDENFMLKRRIEELKSSNEFLLNQNAQLRLNNSLGGGSQPLAVSAVSVSGAMPTQPSIIGITSSSLSGTQPLPTISISTIPTVSCITPVSVSQALQSQPQSQTQIYLPAPNHIPTN